MQKSTQCSRILSAFRESDITSAFMIDELRIFKYSSRIADLRAKGYVIKATRIKKSLWSYHLEDQSITTKQIEELAGEFVHIPIIIEQQTLIDMPRRYV